MKWPLFVAAALLALVADASLMPGFEVAGVSPRLLVILVAFVAIHADGPRVTWAALLAGGLMDLSEPSMTGPRAPFFLIGPHALGLVFGVQAVLGLRGVIVRRNPLAIGAMCLVLSLAGGLVWVGWWTLRAWYPDSPPPWSDGSSLWQLWHQCLQAIATGVVGVPVGWCLLRSTQFWGFPTLLGRGRTQGGTARMMRQ